MRKSKEVTQRWSIVIALLCCLVMFGSDALAYDVDFHGYIEANAVLRDGNSLEEGFFDSAELIQQKNTLKFDVDVNNINYEMGPFVLDKLHLTYRGGYDTIFDLRNSEYDIPEKVGKTRFDYGLEDIKHENDLRECTFDITYQGDLGSLFIRPGRQLVSWGESSAANLCDVINPQDVSNSLVAMPDEQKTPLWMFRAVYNIPPQANFGMNLDIVVSPDIRPTQFGPMDESLSAPYIQDKPFGPFSSLFQNPFFEGFLQDVPENRATYGARMTVDIGDSLSVSGVYYRGIFNGFAPTYAKILPDGSPYGLALAPCEMILNHPFVTTAGGYFSAYISPPLDIVLRGEFAYVANEPVLTDQTAGGMKLNVLMPQATTPALMAAGVPFYLPISIDEYRTADKYKYMIGFSKNFWARWLSPSQVQTSWEAIFIHTQNAREDMAIQWNWGNSTFRQGAPLFQSTNKDVCLLDVQIVWFWWNGRISPILFVIYDTQNNWVTNIMVPWVINEHWKCEAGLLAFTGNEYSRSDYAPEISTGSQATFKLIFQW